MTDWINDNFETLFSGVGVFILGLLVTLFLSILRFLPRAGQWFAEKFIPSVTSVETFPSTDGVYNDDFYAHFKSCFEEAKQCIYITGSGFNCGNQDNIKRADNFINMMNGALARGVTLIRLETQPNGSAVWAKKLALLKNQYPNNFQLYVASTTSHDQLSSIAVFDPESKSNSVVEMMMSVSKTIGVDSLEVAGLGIFIRNEPDLAKSMRDKCVKLSKSSKFIEAITEKDVLTLISGNSFYFAYGSNMDAVQMKRRIPNAEFIGIGTLDNHKLTFNRKGSYRPGGVASVEPAQDKVFGVVWKMKSADILSLTKIEDPTAYTPVKKAVVLENGESVNCNLYVSIKQADFIPPEKAYIKLIVDGAEAAKLPKSYIETIKSIETWQGP